MFSWSVHLEKNACSSLMIQIKFWLLFGIVETNTGFGVSEAGIQTLAHNWLSDFEWQVGIKPWVLLPLNRNTDIHLRRPE